MDFINNLSKREKVLIAVLVFLIVEFLIYSVVFSEKIKNIEEYKYKTESVKLDIKNMKLNSEDKLEQIENEKPILEDNEGFINEFPKAVISTVEDNKTIAMDIKSDEVNKIMNLSKYYSYNDAILLQDEEGYKINFSFKSNNSSILPQMVASEGSVRNKFFNDKNNEIEKTKLDTLKNDLKNKDNKASKSSVTDKKSKRKTELHKEEKEILNKKIENLGEKIISKQEEEKVVETKNIFKIDFDDCKLKNEEISDVMISRFEDGFNIYYDAKENSIIPIEVNKTERFKRLKICISSYLDTSAVVEIKDSVFMISKGRNEIELYDDTLEEFNLKFEKAEENLLSFTIEGEI